MAKFWFLSPPVSCPSLEEEAGSRGWGIRGAHHEDLSPRVLQLEGIPWEAVDTLGGSVPTETSGPETWPTSLLPHGLGGEKGGPGSGGSCVVRGSIGNG